MVMNFLSEALEESFGIGWGATWKQENDLNLKWAREREKRVSQNLIMPKPKVQTQSRSLTMER